MSVRKREWIAPSGERQTAWQVDYRDAKGIRRRKQFDRKKDADQFERKVQDELNRGVHTPDRETVTFGYAAQAWIDEYERLNQGPAVLASYRSFLANHILPAFAQLKLTEVGTLRVQEWISEKAGATNLFTLRGRARRTGDGYSRAFLHRMCSIVSQVLDFGVGQGWLKRNELKDKRVRLPKRPPAERYILTVEETIRLLCAVQERPAHMKGETHRAIVVLYALATMTGMRRGELAGLRWDAIDFERRQIHVRTRRLERGSAVVAGTKTKAGRRTIPIIAPLYTLLLQYRAMTNDPTGLVLRGRNGHPLGLTDISYYHHHVVMERAGLAKPMLSKAGQPVLDRHGKPKVLPKCTFHDLRHLAGSLWIAAGIKPKAVQTLLGHADWQMTMDRYVHLMPHDESTQHALDQLGATFEQGLGLPASAPRLLEAPSPAPVTEVIPPETLVPVNGQATAVIEAPVPLTLANFNEQQEARVHELWREGRTYEEIAAELGISEEKIRRIRKFTPEERTEQNRQKAAALRARRGLPSWTTPAERAQLKEHDAVIHERLRAIVAAGIINQNRFAHRAGVPQATINRFFHSGTGIGAKTRPLIEATIADLEGSMAH